MKSLEIASLPYLTNFQLYYKRDVRNYTETPDQPAFLLILAAQNMAAGFEVSWVTATYLDGQLTDTVEWADRDDAEQYTADRFTDITAAVR